METAVFVVGALVCLLGAFGLVTSDHPVHAALSLVGTLIGIAALFIALDAEFLAAVQIIVYAGAIVVVFLFVIMLIGVDRAEDIASEPIAGQRTAAAVASGALALGLAGAFLVGELTGAPGAVAPNVEGEPNTEAIGRVLFTDHLLAFEITSVLLVIGVVGAVTLARHRGATMIDGDHPGDEVPAVVTDGSEGAVQ